MRDPLELEAIVALDQLLEVLADVELAQVLQVRQPAEQEDALDQLVGVLHLLDALFILGLAALEEAPVLQHPRMQEVLVDRGQLALQPLVQGRQHLRVAGRSPCSSIAP